MFPTALPKGSTQIADRVGIEASKALFDLSRHGTEYVRREIAAGDPSIKMGDGWLGVRRYDTGDGLKRAVRPAGPRLWRRAAVPLHGGDAGDGLRTKRYFQSLDDPAAFHMPSLALRPDDCRTAERAGAVLHENSPVLSVGREGSGYRVRTAGGELASPQVVYCVSALDRNIHRPTGRAVLPVATYVAVTEPLHQDAIVTTGANFDTRRASNYFGWSTRAASCGVGRLPRGFRNHGGWPSG